MPSAHDRRTENSDVQAMYRISREMRMLHIIINEFNMEIPTSK
jgi:hypothetical protein